jgi:hypothetical protein
MQSEYSSPVLGEAGWGSWQSKNSEVFWMEFLNEEVCPGNLVALFDGGRPAVKVSAGSAPSASLRWCSATLPGTPWHRPPGQVWCSAGETLAGQEQPVL